MTTDSLTAEREHLANLLEAVQRCTHFLYASSTKVNWPLDGYLSERLCQGIRAAYDSAPFRLCATWTGT